ncbi:hypothetical protein FNV65_06465 [Streptomyces sp. S1A1-8]|uniref:hypothetical protein n=1 Tax=unclassified Streptomyces TaxID=2593676 RepID=UPI0011637597|nr:MULTISPECIES: hypothetical protein [unclassified Streptomyces]QDN95993.1 hypothetical protein FNV58_07895 [Streptomyces sp. RLB1-9]QDO17714.1 hypothetical protein FNV65_06465 [Streptomyces sp. S1A1-8]QDO27840.1 hypothetical protein FNV63_06455 [Streptomyces sp. S1A1-3]
MTRDKKRKAAIRETQVQTGRRYTQAAREMTAATDRKPNGFLLSQLLTECATVPPADVDWGYDSELAPEVFHSRLLGGAVPYGTVLELAGSLAQEGRSARLTLESMSPVEEAVVVCGNRRFQLILTQDMARELCQTPTCRNDQPGWAFLHCPSHLPDCNGDALVSMTEEWAHSFKTDAGRDVDRLEGSAEADLLIKAATTNGTYERVSKALRDSLFVAPDALDDLFWSEEETLAMQHAIERERLRLHNVARTEARRLWKAVGTCVTCGAHPNAYGWDPSVPPRFCSANCVPPAPYPSPDSATAERFAIQRPAEEPAW